MLIGAKQLHKKIKLFRWKDYVTSLLISPKKNKNTGKIIKGSLPFALHCGYSSKKKMENYRISKYMTYLRGANVN